MGVHLALHGALALVGAAAAGAAAALQAGVAAALSASALDGELGGINVLLTAVDADAAVDDAFAAVFLGIIAAYVVGGSFDLNQLSQFQFPPQLQAWAFPVLFLGFAVLAGIYIGSVLLLQLVLSGLTVVFMAAARFFARRWEAA